MTVKQLAAVTGISEKTINNYEADRHSPRRPSLMAWALATGVPLSWLEDGTSPTPPVGPDGGTPSGRDEALRQLAASKASRVAAKGHNRQYGVAA